MEEKEYRKRIQETFDRIERAFEEVDPDVVECDQQQGALTLLLADRSRCILSAQPSVRQLWMAIASRGIAFHFNFDETKGQWFDDKGKGVEVFAFLTQYLAEDAHIDMEF